MKQVSDHGPDLVLPTCVSEEPGIDAVYLDISAKGTALFNRGSAASADALVPNPHVDIVDWLRDNVRLPYAISERAGPLVLNPIQAAVARRWQRPGVRQMDFVKPPRFGSSLLNGGGVIFFSGHVGADTLFYERTEGDAQDFHDKKLYPMLTESPELAHLLRADTRSGVQDAWMDRILTTGASIQLRGVMTNGSMRAVKGMFIAVDEASSPEYQAGTAGKKGEGSKLALIKRRAQEFNDPIVYVGGTPTVVGFCLTSEEYAKSDQGLFMMPSPCCPGEVQEFWDDIQRVDSRDVRLGKGLRYTCDDATGRPNDVWYECAHCGGAIEETDKVSMMDAGDIVPQVTTGEEGHLGLWAWAAYSTDPQCTWMHIVRDNEAQIKDPDQRQPFMNLVRARPWQPEGPGTVDAHTLADRCEAYPDGHMPAGVLTVTAGVDTQEGGRNGKPRHEIVFVGYGEGEESWILDRVVIDGVPGVDRDGKPVMEDLEPFSPDAARAVWAALDRDWVTADGEVLRPEAVVVDVGYDMNRALAFCHHRESRKRKVIAGKGRREAHGSRMPIITKRASVSKSGYEFQPIGTQSAKDTVYRRLGYKVGGAESIHAPEHLRRDALWDHLAAESLHTDDKGRTWWDVTKPGTSNEALDCLVYAYAALCLRKAKSRRVREASAIKLEARPVPAGNPALAPVALNGSRPGVDPLPNEGRPLAGVRRISGAGGRAAVPAPVADQALGNAPRRFGVKHGFGRGW
ncbi:terminase gpA endonuclease subunit [Methylobacterium iners]|uniref:Terminase n=1 Tax=Methylobacterium iners TaxID=418707 RepID=A0ABQ4S4Q5_9HYPH|nr:terminase gpA endonuclease subunit [Methylobacterium iners]GJD97468.1 hypothetical protein OCOJLMKI_4699 [Methylobacterium iners]